VRWFKGPLLGFDLETTGLDTASDVPVQVALVCSAQGLVESREVFVVDPGCEVPAAAVAVHGISTERARTEGKPLTEAVRLLHSRLGGAEAAGVPIVVMNAAFDVTMAAALFDRFGLPALRWDTVVDPLVIDRRLDRYRKGSRQLDALCAAYGVALDNAHDAGSDADATIALTRAIAGRFRRLRLRGVKALTRKQARWHRAWAARYDAWSRQNGGEGLSPDELDWPLRAPARRPAALPPSRAPWRAWRGPFGPRPRDDRPRESRDGGGIRVTPGSAARG
jgi:DNA polymerase III subunit epsilon